MDIPSNAPRPRLCHITKWSDFDGYGFNLHADKDRPGQYIGKVDADSPASVAGLLEGDRIIEVNGVNISNENHKQVVQRIKNIANETKLLVLDSETDKWYKEHNIVVFGDQANIIFGTSVRSTSTEDNVSATNGHSEKAEEDGHSVASVQSSSHSDSSTQPQPSTLDNDSKVVPETSDLVVESPPDYDNVIFGEENKVKNQEVDNRDDDEKASHQLDQSSGHDETIVTGATDEVDTSSLHQEEEKKSSPHREEDESSPHREEEKSSLHREEDESSPHREEDESSPHREEDESSPHREEDESSPHREEDESSLHREEDKSSLHEDEGKAPSSEDTTSSMNEDAASNETAAAEEVKKEADKVPMNESPKPTEEEEEQEEKKKKSPMSTTPTPPPSIEPVANSNSEESTKFYSYKNGGLNLNMTAAEMRARLASKKKVDPRNEALDLKRKYQIIQNM